MRLLLLLLTITTAFRVVIVNDTRLDIVTPFYPHLNQLIVCNDTICTMPPIHAPKERILILESPHWKQVTLGVDLYAANGSRVDSRVIHVDKPIRTHHYWPLVSLGSFLGLTGLCYLVLLYFPEPKKDKEYHSQRERDRLLAQELGMIQ